MAKLDHRVSQGHEVYRVEMEPQEPLVQQLDQMVRSYRVHQDLQVPLVQQELAEGMDRPVQQDSLGGEGIQELMEGKVYS